MHDRGLATLLAFGQIAIDRIQLEAETLSVALASPPQLRIRPATPRGSDRGTPDVIENHLRLAEAYISLGDSQPACPHLRRCIDAIESMRTTVRRRLAIESPCSVLSFAPRKSKAAGRIANAALMRSGPPAKLYDTGPEPRGFARRIDPAVLGDHAWWRHGLWVFAALLVWFRPAPAYAWLTTARPQPRGSNGVAKNVVTDASGDVFSGGYMDVPCGWFLYCPRMVVMKFRVADGRELWRQDFAGSPVLDERGEPTAPLSVRNGGVFVARSGGFWRGSISALDAATGAIRWEQKFGEAPEDVIRLPRGLAVTTAGAVFAAGVVGFSYSSAHAFVARLNPTDGSTIWSYRDPREGTDAGAIAGTPDGDVVVASMLSGKILVTKFRGADGVPLWETEAVDCLAHYDTLEVLSLIVRVDSSGGILVSGSEWWQTRSLVKLSGLDGTRLWSCFPDGGGDVIRGHVVDFAFDENQDVVGTARVQQSPGDRFSMATTSFKLASADGVPVWSSIAPPDSELASPLYVGATQDNSVVVAGGGDDICVALLDGRDGSEKWRLGEGNRTHGEHASGVDVGADGTFAVIGSLNNMVDETRLFAAARVSERVGARSISIRQSAGVSDLRLRSADPPAVFRGPGK